MDTLKYKALALDLDGTLTDSNKQLPQKNKETLLKAIELGVTVILASGRPVMGMTGLAKKLEMDTHGGMIVAFNGGKIIDCRLGKPIRELVFPRDLISDACAITSKYGAQALSYTDTKIVTECADNEYVQKECKCNYTSAIEVGNLPKFLSYPVPKLLAVGEHEILLKVQEEFLTRYSDRCDCFFSESYFLEMVPKGVAKDQALAQVCEYLNINRSSLMACGDGLNDIPMLKFAGFGVAMQNAYQEAKDAADFVTPVTNDECGVAWAIEKFILNTK